MRAVIDGVRLAGVAAAVPVGREAVQDSSYATPETRRKFTAETGIRERRRTRLGVCTSDLGAQAAERLLDDLDWDRADVDLLVLVTQTADYRLPATAITLQHRLGLPQTCAAFDVNLGCSGYAYGVSMVAGLMTSLGARRALLLAGDTSSLGPPDMPPIFGDAASATAFERDEGAPPIYTDMRSDGGGAEAVMQKRGGYRDPYRKDTAFTEIEDGVLLPDAEFVLDGIEVFNFSVREVPPAVSELLGFAAATIDEVDAFVFHQANGIINNMIAKFLKLPQEKVPSTLELFGNTSSASIPLTLVAGLGARLRNETLRLLLCGFGTGLSWSTVLVQTDRIICPELIEV